MSDTTADRIKNPFTGAFITSWIVFNWKPLVFFIFSSDKIATKIHFIETTYSNIWHLLFYPLASTFIFLFLVPYINLINEWFVKKSKIDREKRLHDDQILLIKRETEIEEKKAEKEIAVEIVRKQENKNLEIENLRSTIAELEKILSSERTRSNEQLQILHNEISESSKKLEKAFIENHELNSKLSTADFEIMKFKEMASLSISERNVFRDEQTRDFIRHRKTKKHPLIINIEGKELLEAIDAIGNLIYFDPETKKLIGVSEVMESMMMNNATEVYDRQKLRDMYHIAVNSGIGLKSVVDDTLTFL